MKKWISKRTRVLLPFGVVLLGLLAMIAIANTRKPPQQVKHEDPGALVNVVPVERGNRVIVVEGDGTVQPRHEVTLNPQVTGKVKWVSEELVAGGSFKKGEVMLHIEATDFQLAVRQAEAAVAQAEYQLELARANADIAQREWKTMQAGQARLTGAEVDSTTEPDALVLQKPQLRQAEAALESAKASLKMAKLNLERTKVCAPFNARVRSISVAPGQLVGPSTPVASLYSTDMVEIPIGVSVADLIWIQVPGSKATISLNTGNNSYRWTGYVDRTLGVVDAIGRLAQVVVRVDHPFVTDTPMQPELSIGSFVRVQIEGREVNNVYPVPRVALRDDNTVWVASDSNALEIRDVTLERLTPDEALVSGGLSEGERIVLTQITGAANGMKLRPITDELQETEDSE